MPPYNICLHLNDADSSGAADPQFAALLPTRRSQLTQQIAQAASGPHGSGFNSDQAWLTRSYPVLAIHTPVMATDERSVEYPGDPMCLYAALSLAVDQAFRARQAMFAEGDPYNDLCPQWGALPSREYRLQAGESGIRDYAVPVRNTDQTIFAPRVWNDEVRGYFVAHVLDVIDPRVVLISTVSPGHRYALDIARTIRRHLPNALIVLGGRHMDETLHYQDKMGQFEMAYSSTLQAMADGRVEPVVDFLISGDGYFALDLLMKAISIAMDLDSRVARAHDVIYVLDQLAQAIGPGPGRAVLVGIDGSDAHVFPLRGWQFDLAELPSPYWAFAVRARFPIFRAADNSVQRTAHMMTVNACPNQCYYCSEGAGVAGRFIRFTHNPAQAALDRVSEYVSYGAEALFFDDSIFWGNNIGRMVEFCEALAQLKAAAASGRIGQHRWLKEPDDWQRLAGLQWGGQLTVETLSVFFQSRESACNLLRSMRAAGCTYIYYGIESLSATVMAQVHKNLHPDWSPWAEDVRRALEMTREAGIRAGASVLFGLDGETRNTIDETIEAMAHLIAEGLLCIASPNILTYHPGTLITHQHGKDNDLDYHSLCSDRRPPYTFFEEAYPNVVSKELSEEDIWYIYRRTQELWGPGAQLPPVPGLIPTGRG